MASPFRVFRKHQKAMLAVLGLLAMIAFVFLPVVMDQMQTRSYADPVVVATETYGDLTRSEISMMIGRRQSLLGFLYQVQQAVQQAGGQATEAMRLSRQIGEATEESVVNTWLFAQKARELGLAVDDAAINAVLSSLVDRVPAERIFQILRDSRMSQAALFEVLEKELLALRLQEMFGVSIAGTTPAQAWDYFRRLNRKATVEVAAIPVERFASEVSAPDEATLREFFQKYKDKLPDPATPEPGFRIPRRIAVEYVKADYEKVLETVEVSDEDIRKYYDEHKENYKREELPSLEPKEEAATPEKPAAEAPATKPSEKPAGEGAAEEQAPEKRAAEKAAPEKPVEKEPAKPAEVKTEPPAEKPKHSVEAEAESEAEPKQTPELAPPANDSSSTRRVSPFSLAVYRAEDANAEEALGDEPEEKAEPSEREATKEKPAETQAATPAKPPAYTPLEEVRDEIRRQLQRERAQARVQELIQRIQEKMEVYYNQWIVYEASVQEGAQTSKKPPARPNLSKLVEGTALTAHSTELLAAFESARLDIGDSWTGSDPFVEYAYAENVPKYKPATSQDNDGNTYLFWKTEEAPEREPEFDNPSVREEVLRQWKLVQARDLAKKEAGELAEAARKSDKSFKEFFAAQKDIPVTEAGPFSWLTYGNIPPMYWLQSQQPPQISEVQGVDMAGPDLMQTIFGLEAGEIGVAMNQPQDKVYVVRAVEFNPLPDVLWTLFLEDRMSRFMATAADRRGPWREWMKEIKESAGFEWKEKPEERRPAS